MYIMKSNEIYRIFGTDYKEMTKRLLDEASLALSIKAKAGCLPSPVIGIKPNLVSPVPASFGATTHPEIIAGIIEYLQENHFNNIIICEGSWVGDKTSDAFEYCGYNTLAKKYGVRIFDTKKDSSYKSKYKDVEFNICSCVKKINFLINVPVLKGHCQTKVTCALKNMKGLIPDTEKRRFHSMGLHRPIAYLNKCIRQDFIVIDGICGDPYFEDGGNPLERNCIMAAKDPVLADAYACTVLGIRPEDVQYIQLAAKEKAGNSCLNDLILTDITDEGRNTFSFSGEPLGTTSLSEDSVPMDIKYAATEIDSCSACYNALVNALLYLKEKGLLTELTEDKGCKFSIGQGFKGTTCTDEKNIGVGNCTRCFARSIPGCPPSPEDIISYLSSTDL